MVCKGSSHSRDRGGGYDRGAATARWLLAAGGCECPVCAQVPQQSGAGALGPDEARVGAWQEKARLESLGGRGPGLLVSGTGA